ncbi:MAG: hypothetical protein JWM78_2855 [Verrucomicrobiaceae bacterium]|nr:hypothetical protein [Verrucomicrobiaceae bacterium]
MSAVDDLFRKSQQLPTIPKVAQELIVTFDQPDAAIDDIAKKIALDQAISAKVLRLANTAQFGGNRKVASIREAVMVLGFNSLRTLVLACSFVDSFRTPKNFDIKKFWLHSFRVAAASKWLARLCKQDGEIAFTCGLLHEIGDLLIMAEHPTQFTNINNSVALGGNRAELELTLFGFTYGDVGAELANRWRFPDAIVNAIRYQSSPNAAQPFSVYAGLIYLAQQVVAQLDIGAAPDQLMEALAVDIVHALKLDTDKMQLHLAELNDLTGDIAAFL